MANCTYIKVRYFASLIINGKKKERVEKEFSSIKTKALTFQYIYSSSKFPFLNLAERRVRTIICDYYFTKKQNKLKTKYFIGNISIFIIYVINNT